MKNMVKKLASVENQKQTHPTCDAGTQRYTNPDAPKKMEIFVRKVSLYVMLFSYKYEQSYHQY